MANALVNAAPQTNAQGIQDDSTKTLVAEAEVLPTHLAKVYIYAKTGPDTPQLVVGNSRTTMYGSDSFDYRKKWANHATVLSNVLNTNANSQMIQRLIPADAGPKSNVRLYLDVLATSIPDYKRNSDGSIQTDSNGNDVPTGTSLAGFIVKWVAAFISPASDGTSNVGAGTIVAGDQVANGVQSQRYPIMDLEVSHYGADGNNIGFRMWAPTTASSPAVTPATLTNDIVYPFNFMMVKRASATSSPTVSQTLDSQSYLSVTWKPKTIDTNTDEQLYIGDRVPGDWEKLESTDGTPPIYSPFGNVHLYDANISLLLQQFYAAEFPYADSFSDFTGAEEEYYLFNMLSGVSSVNSPYHTFQVLTSPANALMMSQSSTVYASGGSDGTMSDTLFAGLVSTAIADYADASSPYQDDAKYPESIFYDSGFPLATKYDLCQFIALRKDTAVVLATHEAGESLTAAQDSSVALALLTHAQLYPESDTYGTPTVRAVIVGRSGTLINSQYTDRLPLSIELANKASKYMGSGDGIWKSTYNFDMAPNNKVELFHNLNVTFTSVTVRNKDWANGMIWIQSFGRNSNFFPAFKTVYDDDTSVLTSFFTMMGAVELTKIGFRAQRQYSGESKLTNEQLIEGVEGFITDSATGRFDGRFIIEPSVTITSADAARGYSWTTVINMYANNMKTIQTLTLAARRTSDYTSSSTSTTTSTS
jgi:hypothetical protein